MILRTNHQIDLQRFEIEKGIGDEERFINFIHHEIKHNLYKEIVKNIEVKETTKNYIDKSKEIDIPIEHARNRVGYLMFEAEVIVILEEQRKDIEKTLRTLYNTQLTCYQQEKVKHLVDVLTK